MSNASYVSVAKPKVGGAIYRAPLGTNLPTDATSELALTFKSLGYVGEDGLVNSSERESTEVKAWGGDVVNNAQTKYSDKFKFDLIEALNPEVLKTVYGDSNVSGDIESGITIMANSQEQKEYSWVIDMVMKDGVIKRIVVPKAKVINVEDINYADGSVVGYATTLGAVPDTSENYHYEYIKAPGEA